MLEKSAPELTAPMHPPTGVVGCHFHVFCMFFVTDSSGIFLLPVHTSNVILQFSDCCCQLSNLVIRLLDECNQFFDCALASFDLKTKVSGVVVNPRCILMHDFLFFILRRLSLCFHLLKCLQNFLHWCDLRPDRTSQEDHR